MKKLKKHIFLMLLILVASFLCIYGLTFAKYISNSVWDYYLKSKGFYFSSDYLGSSSIRNVNNLWNGDSVHFNIRNNLNQTVITSYDINYRIVCSITGDASSHAECHLNGTNSSIQDGVLSSSQICINNTDDHVDSSSFNKTECELGGYEWVNQIATKDLYFDVVLTDNNYELKDVMVDITVSSTEPYNKTLSGTFALHKSNIKIGNVTMDYKNYSDFDRLIISNSHLNTKCVSVTWDSNKLIIDSDKEKFSSYGTDSNGYINEIKFNIGSKKNVNYIFYKKDFNMTYDISEFLIEETDGC